MATDHLESLNDPRLKPRLLRFLLRECLPGENRPAANSSEASSILAAVKTHGLLSERIPDPSDTKLVEAWRIALDAWVERLLSLASSEKPHNCWVGVSFLGVCCEECSSDRFMASYSIWFHKLFSIIQLPSCSSFLREAVCASLYVLFERLAGFPNLKKDATAFAGKVVQIILHLLKENGQGTVLEEMLNLLYIILSYFPSSVLRYYDKVEAFLAANILSSRSDADLSKKNSCCLALVPKVRGDEDSWSLLMQKIIIEIDMLLNDALQGLEGEIRGSTIVRLLIPPGRDPPSQLGLLSQSKDAPVEAIKRFRGLIVPTVSTLIHCCCMMLTNPYPVQVSIPVHALFALVERLLMLDGSVCGSFMAFTTVMNQELVCYELPALHLGSLDLLIAIIKGFRSQLLPHGATIARILIEYSRRATLPRVRIKVYFAMQLLLTSMGVGMALHLGQELINIASADLTENPGSNTLLPCQNSLEEDRQVLLQNGPKKRKHASSGQHPNGTHRQIRVIGIKPTASLSVKTAAIKALETLLTVGGSLRSECWRTDTDNLLMTVAKNACDMGWSTEENSSIARVESTVSQTDFQHAALRAFLASLLSPANVRPPHLSEGLQIFRRGKLEAGTTISAFCATALMSLEVLIHPRALWLVEFEGSSASTHGEVCNRRNPGNMFNLSQKSYVANSQTGNVGPTSEMDVDDDELFNDWLGVGDKGRPVQRLKMSIIDKDQQITEVGQEPSKKQKELISCTNNEINMNKSNKVEEHNSTIDNTADQGVTAVYVTRVEMAQSNDVRESQSTGRDSLSNSGEIGNAEIVSNETMIPVAASKSFDLSNKGKDQMLAYESDTGSLDSLPGIIDGDPDSDSSLNEVP